jgi:CHAT domain-containing protein
MREAARRRTAAPHALLGIGDPALSGLRSPVASVTSQPVATDPAAALARYCRQEGPADPALLRALAPLPDTNIELQAVAEALRAGGGRTTLLARQQATEQVLRKQALHDYRVIYFATHGLLPGELRCRSEPALVLTPEDRADRREEDGLLEASEIASLRLNADLVVLSACNTAGFDQRGGGDSLSGLAEAFLYAGARSLLASHWQVSSLATTQLMTRLFGRLGPDVTQGAAEALRQAQIALSTEPATAHPFFWAAFTLIGDGIDRSRLPSPKPGADT